MKKVLVALVLLLLIFIAAIFAVDSRYYASFVEQVVIKNAAKEQIDLKFDDSHLYPPFLSYRAGKIEARFLRAFSSLQASDVAIHVSFWSLLSMKVALTLEAHAYNGTILAEIAAPFWGSRNTAKIKVRDLDLSLLPQLSMLGVTSGQFNAELGDLIIEDGGRSSGSIAIHLKEFSKPTAFKFPPQIIEVIKERSKAIKDELAREIVGMIKEVPAVTRLNLSSSLKWAPEGFSLETLESRSSWGEITGQSQFKINAATGLFEEGSSEFTVRLTTEGSSTWGPFLPLISNHALRAEDRSFRVESVITQGRQSVKYTRIG